MVGRLFSLPTIRRLVEAKDKELGSKTVARYSLECEDMGLVRQDQLLHIWP